MFLVRFGGNPSCSGWLMLIVYVEKDFNQQQEQDKTKCTLNMKKDKTKLNSYKKKCKGKGLV